MSFNNYFPSDVVALKRRVAPWVTLVDALVARTPAVPRDLRAGWKSFVAEWRAFLEDDGVLLSPQRFERGVALEGKLRDWRSALSSFCPGVPAPAPKRSAGLFGTWATPADVRAQKARTDPLLRDLNDRVAACPSVDPALRSAWSDFYRGWVAFFGEGDEWIHGASQLECAQAYEDAVPEWRDAVAVGGCREDAQHSPPPQASAASPSPPGPTWAPPPPWWPSPPSATAPGVRVAGALAAGAAVLVIGFAIAKGAR